MQYYWLQYCTGVYNPNDECEVGDLDDPEGMMKKCVADVCQPGNCLQCAGYVLYSSSTMLVLTVGTGVFGFTLDPLVGEFVLTHDNIKIPDSGKIYSFNEGNYALWDKPVQEYMDSLKDADKWGGKPYSVRLLQQLCSQDPVSLISEASEVGRQGFWGAL